MSLKAQEVTLQQAYSNFQWKQSNVAIPLDYFTPNY